MANNRTDFSEILLLGRQLSLSSFRNLSAFPKISVIVEPSEILTTSALDVAIVVAFEIPVLNSIFYLSGELFLK